MSDRSRVYLSIFPDESVIVGSPPDEIRVSLKEKSGKRAKLLIEADRRVPVVRRPKEMAHRVPTASNQAQEGRFSNGGKPCPKR